LIKCLVVSDYDIVVVDVFIVVFHKHCTKWL